MRYPSNMVGDTRLVANLTISLVPIHLIAIVGYSNGVAPYLLVFDKAPVNGQPGRFTIYVAGQGNYALALPNPVDMDQCYVIASSTPDSLTPVAGNNQNVMALVAS